MGGEIFKSALKSDSHVPELNFSSFLFKKLLTFVCLVFKNENKKRYAL